MQAPFANYFYKILRISWISKIHAKFIHIFRTENLCVPVRETREGWPLLTVETEVNGDSKSTNKRVLLVPVQEISVLPLAVLVGPEQKIFPYRTLFQFLCPQRPASWAGSRAGSPVSKLCVSGANP